MYGSFLYGSNSYGETPLFSVDVEISHDLITFTFTLPDSVVGTGKQIDHELLTFTFTTPDSVVGTGQQVDHDLINFTLSVLDSIVATGKQVDHDLINFAFTTPDSIVATGQVVDHDLISFTFTTPDGEVFSFYDVKVNILAKKTGATTIRITEQDEAIPTGLQFKLYRADSVEGAFAELADVTLPYDDTVTEATDYRYKGRVTGNNTRGIISDVRVVKAEENIL